jgi:ribosomal protein S18 acetylase RimI-like enzyme
LTSRRAAAPADEPFLRRLFAEVRAPELAALPLPEPEREALLNMQYAGRERSYGAAHPDAERSVICAEDGEEVGALWVDRSGAEIALLDIALLGGARGRGLGTEVLGDLLEEARERGCPVSLHVERHNPARRLYERLGFAETAADEVYLQLTWRPPAQANTAS